MDASIHLRQLLSKQRWVLLVAPLVAAILGGTAATLSSEPVFEATGLLSIGLQGEVDPFGLSSVIVDKLVEPAQKVVDRLQTPSEQDVILEAAGIAMDAPEADLFRASLMVKVAGTSDVVQIRARASNPNLADKLIRVAADRVAESHEKLRLQWTLRQQSRMRELESYIGGLEKNKAKLIEIVAGDSESSGPDRAAEAVSLLALHVYESDLRRAREHKSQLNHLMDENIYHQTKLMDAPSISGRSRASEIAAIAMASAFIGLIVALSIVMAKAAGSDSPEKI